MRSSVSLKYKLIVISVLCVLPITVVIGAIFYSQQQRLLSAVMDTSLRQQALNLRQQLEGELDVYSSRLEKMSESPLLVAAGILDSLDIDLKKLAREYDIDGRHESVFLVSGAGGVLEGSFLEPGLNAVLIDSAPPLSGITDNEQSQDPPYLLDDRDRVRASMFMFDGEHYLSLWRAVSIGNSNLWMAYVVPSSAFSPHFLRTNLNVSSGSYVSLNDISLRLKDNQIVFGRLGEATMHSYNEPWIWRGMKFYIHVNANIISGADGLSSDRVLIFWLFVFLLIVQAASISWVAQFFLLKRLDIINIAAKKFSSGEFGARANVNGTDEIGALATVFNGLCAEVAQGQLYLKKMVELRTRQAHESATKLQAILSTVGEAIISIDATGNIMSFNRQAELMFGYKETEVVGKSVSMLMPKSVGDLHGMYLMQSKIDSIKNIFGKYRVLEAINSDHHTFPILLTVNPGEVNNKRFFTGVIRDQSEQLKTERKLAEQERLLKVAMETSVQPMAMTDSHGVFLDFNDALCSWLGVRRNEILKTKLYDIVADEHVGSTHVMYEEMRVKEIVSVVQEKQFKRSGGGLAWGKLSSTAVFDESGDMQFVVSQITDIDDTMRLASELESRNRDLERSNRDLDQFAYVASHDLKSPLNAIKKIASWIEEDIGEHANASVVENISLLKIRAQRMIQLLNDLLDYSRVGKMSGRAENIQLRKIGNDIFDVLDKPSGFEFHSQDVTVCVPRVPFELALRNLISNSIKHHDMQRGCISLEVKEYDGEYVFSVIDNGPGIAPEFQQQALEMFRTLKSRDHVEGSGMGLAMVKRTVEHFGGTLMIDSDGIRGTSVTMTWRKLQPVCSEAP